MNSASDKHSESHPTVTLLKQLLRLKSITPDDAGCQEILCQRLRPLGFACEDLPFGDVKNLYARRGSSGPVFCFAGHTDVVPPGADDEWQSDPFEPVTRDGELYARGAADMKGSLAAMIVATEEFLAEHEEHAGSIAFLITSDEEGRARDGTLQVMNTLQAREEHIDWCVIGEPSSQNELGDIVRIGRRGSLSGILQVLGTQGHVAYPQLADNPIGRFAPILAELYAIEWDNGNDAFPPTSFQFVDISVRCWLSERHSRRADSPFHFRYSTVWNHESLQSKVEAIFDSIRLVTSCAGTCPENRS